MYRWDECQDNSSARRCKHLYGQARRQIQCSTITRLTGRQDDEKKAEEKHRKELLKTNETLLSARGCRAANRGYGSEGLPVDHRVVSPKAKVCMATSTVSQRLLNGAPERPGDVIFDSIYPYLVHLIFFHSCSQYRGIRVRVTKSCYQEVRISIEVDRFNVRLFHQLDT